MTLNDRANKRRFGTSLFWAILGAIFIFGGKLPHWLTGLLVLVMVAIDGTGGVSRGHYDESTKAEQAGHASRVGNRIFWPVLLIPIVTFGFALAFRVPYMQRLFNLDPTRAALIGLGFGGVAAMAACLRITGD